jgi:hypothetical protein
MSKAHELRTRAAHFGLAMGLAALLLTASARAAVVVNDSWVDEGRTNGTDPQDAAWWSSTSSTGNSIEVSLNNLGLISGSSGRGIHGTFAPQTLAEGERLTVTFTFTTPNAVGSNLSTAFRIGLFNRSNNAALEADLSASSGSPNALYNPVSGYMLDFDVNLVPSTDANVTFREKDPVPGSTGQLMSTTTGFVTVGSGGVPYTISGDKTYTGVYSVARTASSILELSGSLSDSSGVLSSFTTTDASPSATTFDMLGFHAITNAFGNNTTAGDPNNGINFSNITIDVSPIPEPGTALLATGFACLALRRRRHA